jgi:hypothetical protein
MDFEIRCECGTDVVVSEGAAGARIQCACGRTVTVPSLDELRQNAGLPPTKPSPELAIEHLLATGMLPGTNRCAFCGAATEHRIVVVTECERAWTPRSRSSALGSVLGLIVFGWVFLVASLLYREGRNQEEYGRDKVYRLPLPVCTGCQPAVRGKATLQQCLRQIPEYRRLLEKFPDARVAVLDEAKTR